MLYKLMSRANDDAASGVSGVRGPDIAGTTDLSGWEGRELVFKAGKSNSGSSLLPEYLRDANGGPVMELRPTSSMERILRYQTSLKRDLYRAMHTLINVKREASANARTCGSDNAPDD